MFTNFYRQYIFADWISAVECPAVHHILTIINRWSGISDGMEFLFGDETTLAFSIELVNPTWACALKVSLTVAFLPKFPVATQHTFSVFFERDFSFLCKSGDGSGSFVLSKTER